MLLRLAIHGLKAIEVLVGHLEDCLGVANWIGM